MPCSSVSRVVTYAPVASSNLRTSMASTSPVARTFFPASESRSVCTGTVPLLSVTSHSTKSDAGAQTYAHWPGVFPILVSYMILFLLASLNTALSPSEIRDVFMNALPLANSTWTPDLSCFSLGEIAVVV